MVTVEVVYTRICLRFVIKLSNAQLDEARGEVLARLRGQPSPTEYEPGKHSPSPPVQNNLFGDFLLCPFALCVHKVVDPVGTFLSAINDVADPQ